MNFFSRKNKGLDNKLPQSVDALRKSAEAELNGSDVSAVEGDEKAEGEREGAESEGKTIDDNAGKESDEVKHSPLEEDAEIQLPPEPELKPPIYGMAGNISFWGFSQQGASHAAKDLPCQDRCLLDVIDGTSIVIAAIADGVGSCALSHYGAAAATTSAIDFLKSELSSPDLSLDDVFAGKLLRSAMKAACESVRQEAEGMEQFEYSFQSTLTLAVYDGSTLFFAHAGDDGIVAILEDGTMDLATVRKKGEEAGSVLPLQSMDWEIRKSNKVKAFIMATDGVLDAFVRSEKEGNRIYYPFIEPAMTTTQQKSEDVKEVADFYYNYMAGPEYRSKVRDDLTMVVVVNQGKNDEKNLPQFDQEAWNQYYEERSMRIKAALYPDHRFAGPGCDSQRSRDN